MSLLPEKCVLQRLVCKLPNIRFLAPPSASDIDNLHAILVHEALQHQGRAFIVRRPLRQMNPRFPMLLSKFRCAFAPASQRWRESKNHRGIRVPYIPLGPLEVARRRRFVKRVGQ